MNRFLLLAIVVAGVIFLPYLLWLSESKTQVTMDASTQQIVNDREGFEWLFRYAKVESAEQADYHLTLFEETLTREEWEVSVNREEPQLMIFSRMNWLGMQDDLFVREVQEYVGFTATGWVAAYFEDLSLDNPAIPEWAKEGQTGVEGGGFIVSNERLETTLFIPSETSFIQAGTDNTGGLTGWIDIVEPIREDDGSMWFSFPEQIAEEVISQNIPVQFPGMMMREHGQTRTVYLAGDVDQLESSPGIYQLKGLPTVYKYLYQSRGDSTYWTTFVPAVLPLLKTMEEPKEDDDVLNEFSYPARISQDRYQVKVGDVWEDMVIKGVNIGMGKPGYFPGEAAITEEEYYWWFEQIAEMNANTIRVYTIHPPGFYRALQRFNEGREEPLYVLHGAWVEEEPLEEYGDAFNNETMEKFEKEYKNLVDLVHGNKRIAPQVGHASGIYDADVSQYIIGWLIGIEWYPEVVVGTNEAHPDLGDYSGTYIETKEASAFEHWIAEHMDRLLTYEQQNYNQLRPISFSNWVTTDLLDHPSEPLLEEDIVSVNPNVVHLKGQMEDIGQFASYHVYPYYPDFFNVDKTYGQYVDQDGEFNSYAGYLNELRQAHDMPVLIAEFGIPASRGGTHVNPYGWNQGNVDEQSQGDIIAKLFRTILAENYLGGLVFSWQDEWFKRTWNTMDYDNPERRPYWSNQQTNEQHFGLLSFDSLKIQPDGSDQDWTEPALVTSEETSLSVTHEEAYLYLRIDGVSEKDHVVFSMDTVADQGNTTMTQFPSLTFETGAEFVGELNGADSRLWIDTYYDLYHYLYGNKLDMIDTVSSGTKNSGEFTPIYYVLNKEMYYPELDQREQFQFYETGKLTRGNANPEAKNYNSLADYEYGEDFVEIRLPWLLLQFRDPSQREVVGNLFEDGETASLLMESLQIEIQILDQQQQVSKKLPPTSYSWDTWNQPTSLERLKPSYYTLKELFGRVE